MRKSFLNLASGTPAVSIKKPDQQHVQITREVICGDHELAHGRIYDAESLKAEITRKKNAGETTDHEIKALHILTARP